MPSSRRGSTALAGRVCLSQFCKMPLPTALASIPSSLGTAQWCLCAGASADPKVIEDSPEGDTSRTSLSVGGGGSGEYLKSTYRGAPGPIMTKV